MGVKHMADLKRSATYLLKLTDDQKLQLEERTASEMGKLDQPSYIANRGIEKINELKAEIAETEVRYARIQRPRHTQAH